MPLPQLKSAQCEKTLDIAWPLQASHNIHISLNVGYKEERIYIVFCGGEEGVRHC